MPGTTPAATGCRRAVGQLFLAVALPPLLPAFFFWAVVPPWEELLFFLPDPLAFPPRLDEPSELAIRAARDFDIPLSLSASYCFSFFTFPGIATPPCRRFGHADLSGVLAPLTQRRQTRRGRAAQGR